jgi:ERCC4-related helicase
LADNFTAHQKKYFAHQLKLSRPTREVEALASSMSGVKVDLNPHQVEAALFALKSPISNGSLLADEVGLGKTIEAGLVLAQLWAERKRRILLILPASLRVQWKTELEEKFNIPCTIVERPKARPKKNMAQKHPPDPFVQATTDGRVAICSYEFASICSDAIAGIPWDLAVLDEAHRLRNVYKATENARAKRIKQALAGRKKLLLTATPLQNNLKEMYGLATVIDEHLFGDASVFASAPITEIRQRLKSFCIRTLRKDVSDTGYIKFTKRQVITRTYMPGDDERELYDRVTKYLQQEMAHALPKSGRRLVAIVIRKLLASSPAALSKTMQSLIDRLEAMLADDNAVADGDIESDIAKDFDAFGEYSEEFANENDCDESPNGTSEQKDRHGIQQELKLLKGIKAIADGIQRDAKGANLLTALKAGFTQVEENRGQRKAVIFTESVRTQEYILGLLNEGGFEGHVVLLNGSNKDEISKRVYAQWKNRHKNDGAISGSSNADMKAAIVEEFRDRATILIGTEAAAEGVNLQFCSMVVNYDLPWNPQRVEQRIGRCHRYGQKYDVVVVNFVNQANAADLRVYEILGKKFKLFEGVFGSSDEVLGALERGIDFERAIFDILQKCRTNDEINREFDALTQQYSEIIETRRNEAIQQVLMAFDEDVTARLKDCETRTRASLSRFERWKFALFAAHGATKADDDALAFDYKGSRYLPSWEHAKTGRKGIFLATESPIYINLLKEAAALDAPTAKIKFNHSAQPAEDQIAFFTGENSRISGSASIDKLTFSYGREGQSEEHLLISIVTDNGAEIDSKTFDRMMEVPAQIVGPAEPDPRMGKIREENQAQRRGEIDEANKKSLVQRFMELDAWRNDCEDALIRELDDLQVTIRLKKGQMGANVGSLSFQEIVELNAEINRLTEEKDQKQRQVLQRKDTIRKSAKDLQDEASRLLNGQAAIENIMAFSFEMA